MDNVYDDYNEYDHCYECSGLGDNYFINDDGELEPYCPYCPINPNAIEDWED